MKRVVQPLSVLLFGALLGVGWIVFSLNMPNTPSKPRIQPPASTDYYMRNADVEVMNRQGTPIYRMQAQETLHYPDKSARMTTVHVDYLGGADGVWKLDAVHGHMLPDEQTILLTDGVQIRSDSEQGQTAINTPEATVDLQGNVISSAEVVTVDSPDYRAKAFGMQAGFNSRDLTLLKDVQSELHVH